MTEFASHGADQPYPIRPITIDEFDAFQLVDQHGFNSGPLPEGHRERILTRFEFDRSLAAMDGSTPVGITMAYSFRLSVPGQEILPAAGVTWVSVLPTYRRRGVLSSIMRRQLNDIRERGEPLAVLWASESAIYSRYGYGRASWNLGFTIRRGESAMARTVRADDSLSLRLADPEAVLPELAKVYDSVLPSRPGLFVRNEWWWQRRTFDPPEERHGASPLRCLIAEDASGPRGYALYSGVAREGDMDLPNDLITVRELMTTDAAASAALWVDLLNRDLTAEVQAPRRPVDDPLLYQLADPRRARTRLGDALWARIIDVPGALSGRRYSAPVDLVIEVRDDMFAENAGRWRLTADGPGSGSGGKLGLSGRCIRTDAAADLALDVTELGAAYLGGTRIGTLAEAGLVTEMRAGAVRQLSAAMAWDPAPWCPIVF